MNNSLFFLTKRLRPVVTAFFTTLVLAGCSTLGNKNVDTASTPNTVSICGKTPFSKEFGGINSKIAAKLSSDAIPALKEFADQISSDPLTISAEANLALVRKTTNLIIASAYQQVIENYTCYLKQNYPQDSEKIMQGQAKFIELINEIFDKDLYIGTYAEKQERKNAVLSQVSLVAPIIATAHSTPVAKLPNPNFTETTTVQLDVLVNSGIGNVYSCLGTRFSSIASIDERALSGLQSLRSNYLMYMEGTYNARTAASSIMTVAKTIYDSPSQQPNLTVADTTCLRSIIDEIEKSTAKQN